MPATLFRPAALLAATLALGACSTYGGYGGVSVGYGGGYGGYDRYGYDRYGYDRYDRYGYSPYYGWYDGFYYPGTGYYLYDRYGSRYRWDDRHRHYWESRRRDRNARDNWSDYRGETPREGNPGWRREPREERPAGAQGNRSWGQTRSDATRSRNESRREARPQQRESRSEQREVRQENRGWRTKPRD
jgi:hypothetical protein